MNINLDKIKLQLEEQAEVTNLITDTILITWKILIATHF